MIFLNQAFFFSLKSDSARNTGAPLPGSIILQAKAWLNYDNIWYEWQNMASPVYIQSGTCPKPSSPPGEHILHHSTLLTWHEMWLLLSNSTGLDLSKNLLLPFVCMCSFTDKMPVMVSHHWLHHRDQAPAHHQLITFLRASLENEASPVCAHCFSKA